MLAKVWTCAVVGLDGELVQVEVDIARQGLVQFNVVGLPDTAVQEARERVRAAVAEPIRLADATWRVTASVGVAVATEGDDGAEALLDRADRAMYEAKRRRR